MGRKGEGDETTLVMIIAATLTMITGLSLLPVVVDGAVGTIPDQGLSNLYDNVRDACEGTPTFTGELNLDVRSGGKVTVCGQQDRSLCYEGEQVGDPIDSCDSIELESGCTLTGEQKYAVIAESDKAVISCR